ncbi:MazG-like family protein [Streptomyces sp. NPDC006743]|uniref:MazG-like family protein n=1 Tax=Streptomyces sp. NPDC006743 TaxID=3154480 RepID=UPI00345420BF
MTDPDHPAVEPWATIDALWAWLDGHRAHDSRETLLLRMLKLSEEVGEAAQAVIGATGQNPRKGTTHTWQDVEAELCDVVITAMVALRTLTPDAGEVFAHHLARVRERSLGPAGPNGGNGPAGPGEQDAGTGPARAGQA